MMRFLRLFRGIVQQQLVTEALTVLITLILVTLRTVDLRQVTMLLQNSEHQVNQLLSLWYKEKNYQILFKQARQIYKICILRRQMGKRLLDYLLFKTTIQTQMGQHYLQITSHSQGRFIYPLLKA